MPQENLFERYLDNAFKVGTMLLLFGIYWKISSFVELYRNQLFPPTRALREASELRDAPAPQDVPAAPAINIIQIQQNPNIVNPPEPAAVVSPHEVVVPRPCRTLCFF